MENFKAQTPIEMIETLSAEIEESESLLAVIYQKNEDNPGLDCAIACLLRSLSVTKEKSHSYAEQLSERLRLHNESGSTTFAASSSSTPLGPHFYPEPTTIGDRIKSMRELRNLGQFYLASSIGVTRSCIEAWEENTTIPGCDRLMPLANALNCDPMWLLTGKESGGAQ